MHIRKFYDIADMNRVGMFDYRLISLADETLLIVGDRGYPDYFRVEIKFFAIEYIACPRSFTEPIRWRMASQEEATRIFQEYIDYTPYIARPVYCIEEDVASYIPLLMPRKKIEKVV